MCGAKTIATRAVVVDHHRRAGVGGAQHGPLQFEAAQPRDVEVLRHRDGLAEPADVAQVGEHGRRAAGVAEARRQLLAEQVLVADVGADALALDDEGRRRERAAAEVAERDVHQVGEPAEHRRDELAEGHEVLLVVAVGGWPAAKPTAELV